MKVFNTSKKILLVIGRAYTLLSVLFTLSLMLMLVSAPVQHALTAGRLGALYNGDALILPVWTAIVNLTVISVVNLLLFRKDLPLYDHLLSLIQMPMLVFGTQTAMEMAQRSFLRGNTAAAITAMVVYAAALIAFSVLMIRSTCRYVRKDRRGKTLTVWKFPEQQQKAA
ncbi:MAG: hypothetical protein IJ766_03600 [Clostridia bacterium]|nr:hypothetical protein [Clostridia bacterium]